MPESYADARGRIASAREAASAHPVVRLADPQPEGIQPGHAAFAVGEHSPFAVAVVPVLDPEAPDVVVARYHSRIVALATGRCPLCDALAGPDLDPEHEPHAWNALRVVVRLRHDLDCPATFTEDDRHWFPIFREDES